MAFYVALQQQLSQTFDELKWAVRACNSIVSLLFSFCIWLKAGRDPGFSGSGPGHAILPKYYQWLHKMDLGPDKNFIKKKKKITKAICNFKFFSKLNEESYIAAK